ncbi:ATP-binding protein [Streptomyces sp. BR123]|uniref:ATP-binding protein n=1 Tax=Streptomyces sp. BR123 TaxID=2749828 RepID=UPI0015C4E024|nr:ATP-binding protein [Streptomyces sp. BR123]NXY95327.1 ATP-binding protein [Streptomyces sp. BR123]
MATTNIAATAADRTYRFTAPSLADTPRLAREWVALILRAAGLAHLVDRARLCTSEVVTNAHRHTDTPEIAVELVLLGGRVTVYVSDCAPGRWPTSGGGDSRPGRLDTHGRGLALVAAYADDWDVSARPDRKAVWFRLA